MSDARFDQLLKVPTHKTKYIPPGYSAAKYNSIHQDRFLTECSTDAQVLLAKLDCDKATHKKRKKYHSPFTHFI